MPGNVFWDSNVWIYLFSNSEFYPDQAKKAATQRLLAGYDNTQLVISSQVINETVQVLSKKLSYPPTLIRELMESMIEHSKVVPLTSYLSLRALEIFQTYRISWYDSLIVASALEGKCSILISEDMQNGMVFEKALTVVNPFLDLQ